MFITDDGNQVSREISASRRAAGKSLIWNNIDEK
jgi:hypothetical protein